MDSLYFCSSKITYNMKKIITIFAMVLCCAASVVKGQVFFIDGVAYRPINEVSIQEGSYFSGDVVIPDVINKDGQGYWVTEISRGAFDKSNGVTSIKLGLYVKTIAPYAIYGTFSRIKLNMNLAKVDPLSFYGCPNLEYIDASECSYLADDEGVLYDKDMSELKIYPIKKKNEKYVIPEGVRKILHYAFWETQIVELDIPSSIQVVGGFDNAPYLKTIVVRAINPPSLFINSVDTRVLRECTIYVPEESIEAYQQHKDWGKFNKIKGIGEYVSVKSVRNPKMPKGYYDIKGVRHNELQDGVNIVVEEEGGVKKIVK